MSEQIAEFPFPFDATDEERATARMEIAKHTRILEEEKGRLRFEGRALGQTGPIHRFQYFRIYQVPKGFLVAGHELREGIKVFHADTADAIPHCFTNEGVAEFIADELRFRGVIKGEHATA